MPTSRSVSRQHVAYGPQYSYRSAPVLLRIDNQKTLSQVDGGRSAHELKPEHSLPRGTLPARTAGEGLLMSGTRSFGEATAPRDSSSEPAPFQSAVCGSTDFDGHFPYCQVATMAKSCRLRLLWCWARFAVAVALSFGLGGCEAAGKLLERRSGSPQGMTDASRRTWAIVARRSVPILALACGHFPEFAGPGTSIAALQV